MDINQVTPYDIRKVQKQMGIDTSTEEETDIFEIDGLKSSLMGMLPGHEDSLRR